MPKKDELPDVRSGRVRITCGDPDMTLEGWLGPDSPKYTGGFGGWNITPRPRQVGMVTFDGVEPITLEFQLVWDGILGSGRHRRPREHVQSIEPDIRDLLAVVRGDKESDPGICRVEGIPSLPTKRWVISNVEFGDAIRRESDMHRTRLMLTFTMIEYVPPKFERLRKRAFGKDLGKTVTHTVGAHETPNIIAKRRHCKWTDIRQLNQQIVRTANQKLKVGTKLRVPARKTRSSTSKK
jgi:LysM domain